MTAIRTVEVWSRNIILDTVWPDDDLHRTAVHEAGHAVAAWRSTAVVTVYCVSIEGDARRAGYIDRQARPDPWSELVLSLAGIAAELVVYKKVSTRPSSEDLMKAREQCERLAAAKADLAWSTDGPQLPFDQMFARPLNAEALRIMQQGFAMARQIVVSGRKAHHSLVQRLVETRVLVEGELVELLGNRALVRALGQIGGDRFIL